MTVVYLSVKPDLIRTISDPNFDNIKTTLALIKLADIENLELSPNPRVPRVNKVTKQILESACSIEGIFHLLNRGLTISAKQASYDNKKEILKIDFNDSEQYGVLDGGHTLFSILEAKSTLGNDSEALNNNYVRLEIIQGIEEHISKISRARNFSTNVKDKSLANLEKSFEWLKDALGKKFADKVAWFENDEGDIDVVEIAQILTAIHPEISGPAKSYSSANFCLNMLADSQMYPKWNKIVPIVRDICVLYDRIRLSWWLNYKDKDAADGKYNRPNATKEVKLRKRGADRLLKFPFADVEVDPTETLHVEKGLVFPLLSSFRALIGENKKGKFEWLTDPFEFLEKYGKDLVGKVMDASDVRGKNPQTVGKDATVYDALKETVQNRYWSELVEQKKGVFA